MNAEPGRYQRRMLNVAAFLDHMPREGFDMSTWYSVDGGPSCLAGWSIWYDLYGDRAMSLSGDTLRSALASFVSLPVYDMAALYYDLSWMNRLQLFIPMTCDLFGPNWTRLVPEFGDGGIKSRQAITPAWAAATLRHLAVTNVVDWRACRPPEQEESTNGPNVAGN